MSSPVSPSAAQATKPLPTPWQDKLKHHCQMYGIVEPKFEEMSDKRGGRTAWSAKVLVKGEFIQARYWYDVKYVHNAKEDAAEFALQVLQVIPSPRSTHFRYPSMQTTSNFRAIK